MQHGGIDDARDGRSHPNAQRHRQNGDDGESGLADQQARAVAKVLKHCFHHTASPYVVAKVLPERDVSKPSPRMLDRRMARRAGALVVLGAHADVEFELLADLTRDRVAVDETANSRSYTGPEREQAQGLDILGVRPGSASRALNAPTAPGEALRWPVMADDRIEKLLEEVRDAQREHLAEYRRVTQESLELQRQAVKRQQELGRTYIRVIGLGGGLVFVLVLLLVYLLMRWGHRLFG